MRSAAALAATLCCACGPKNATTPAPPGGDAWPVTVPSGNAARYNEQPTLAAPGPISDAVLAAVNQAARLLQRPEPNADSRMFAACHSLAAVVPQLGSLPVAATDFAFQSNGLIESSPYILVVWGSLKKPAEIADQLRPVLTHVFEDGAIERVGVGAVEREPDEGFGDIGAVVVAFLPSHVQTSAIPRSLPAGATLQFELALQDGRSDPHVFITRPDGETMKIDPQPTVGEFFRVRAECGWQNGQMQVQIVAGESNKEETLALFPVWCGATPPSTFIIAKSPNDVPNDPREGERQLFVALNVDRKAAGRRALEWSDAVAQLARDRAARMKQPGRASTSEEPVSAQLERVLGHRVSATGVVGNAFGIIETHRGLMDRPSTRARLMLPEATQVGIGLVWGDEVSLGVRQIFVTEILVGPAGP